MKHIVMTVLMLASALTASAEVRLPAVIGNGMVLQQRSEANLWGKAAPGRKVIVEPSWSRQKYTATAGADSLWQVSVATPGAGGPYAIVFDDGDRLTLDDILIGEVWICTGQSNMEMPMQGFWNEPVNRSLETLLDAGRYDRLRLFTVDRVPASEPRTDCNGRWQVSTSASAADFSATAYFFGRNLIGALDVPVGLISTCRGATRIETWMDVPTAQTVDPGVLDSDASQDAFNKTAALYNGMIVPVQPFTARGFIWYQGEANLYNYPLYADNMAAMVALWRERWGDDRMAFYYVQLAPFGYDDPQGTALPLTIEQQVRALDKIPHSGIASTTDIGAAETIHPRYKDLVGQRLAAVALSRTYGMKGFPAMPHRMRSVRFEGDRAIVDFEGESGFVRPAGTLAGFELAGADRKFHPAVAWLGAGNTVEVRSDAVPRPVAVRYAFRNLCEASLFNASGIPAVPFRTDDWDDVR